MFKEIKVYSKYGVLEDELYACCNDVGDFILNDDGSINYQYSTDHFVGVIDDDFLTPYYRHTEHEDEIVMDEIIEVDGVFGHLDYNFKWVGKTFNNLEDAVNNRGYTLD